MSHMCSRIYRLLEQHRAFLVSISSFSLKFAWIGLTLEFDLVTGPGHLDPSLRKNFHKTTMAQAFKKFVPMFDRILVERFLPELKTKGGIMLPEKSQGKMVQATVVAVGPGARGENGSIVGPSVKVGDKVLLPEYGGTKVIIEDQDYFLFRDTDLLGKFDN